MSVDRWKDLQLPFREEEAANRIADMGRALNNTRGSDKCPCPSSIRNQQGELGSSGRKRFAELIDNLFVAGSDIDTDRDISSGGLRGQVFNGGEQWMHRRHSYASAH